jgi:putative tricarboxylic transport membrane protein
MIKGDLLSGTFWICFSIVMAMESYRVGIGNLHSPQAGFFPFVASILMGFLSLILLLSTKARKHRENGIVEDISFHKNMVPKVIYVAIALFLYAALLNLFGFVLVSVLLMAFMLRAIEPQKWVVVGIVSILTPILAFLLFDVFLKVQLPKGVLNF